MKKALLLVLAALILSAPAYAQLVGLQGKNEISFAAAWEDTGSDDSVTLQATYGRFITPNLEPQLALTWRDAGDDRSVFIAPAILWNFVGESTTSVVPYVGLGWYFVDIEDGIDESENGLEILAGVRFFFGGDYLTSSRAVFAEYRYLNDVFGDNVNRIMVGITNFF